MAKKHLGQHFLSDPRILGRIADALPAAPGDPVVEIGPGRGALTAVLLGRGFAVTAIERDRDLVPILRAAHPALRLLEADALEVDWPRRPGRGEVGRWWLIGNILHNITSPLIDRALAACLAPGRRVPGPEGSGAPARGRAGVERLRGPHRRGPLGRRSRTAVFRPGGGVPSAAASGQRRDPAGAPAPGSGLRWGRGSAAWWSASSGFVGNSCPGGFGRCWTGARTWRAPPWTGPASSRAGGRKP
ncbi:MAG: rRNA adenine N-6-methyltransferase family protein [Gemmatimonadales bacterium]